jgi:tripartite-type tricarboxylate transporter receptor subunit TctC
LNYASSGIGSANHVLTERFKRLAGIDMVHVPYRGGAPLIAALMAGEVQFALLDYGTAEAALRSGRARALAQSGTRRHPALPDVPTLSEAGFKGYDPSFWIGLAVPRSTPEDVTARLNRALNQALAQTALKARAQALGWTLVSGGPQLLAETVARDVASYGETVSGLNLHRP